MKKILIMTDSGSDITIEDAKEYGIHLIPFTITQGDKSYVDKFELTPDMLYNGMAEGKMPKTSQITFAQHYDEFIKFADEYSIIYIPISAKASGSYQSAVLAMNNVKEEKPDADITIIENSTFSWMYGYIAIKAAKMASDGKSVQEICDMIYGDIKTVRAIFVVDDLKYLQMGGRISTASKIIGDVLDIKPILKIEDGLVSSLDKVRGSKKVMPKMISLLSENADTENTDPIILMHSNCYEKAENYRDSIIEKTSFKDVLIKDIGATIGSHTGPGTIGIIYHIK